MGLAVLGDSGVPQVHGRPSWADAGKPFKREGWHYIGLARTAPDQQRTYDDQQLQNSQKQV
jgi:hypothetical protein